MAWPTNLVLFNTHIDISLSLSLSLSFLTPPPPGSMGVVEATSECLRAILATKTATFVLSKLEEQNSSSNSVSELASEWYLYLEPFKPNKKKKVPKK